MFLCEDDFLKFEGFEFDFIVIDILMFEVDLECDGMCMLIFVLFDFDCSMVLIGGIEYVGEIKKSVFVVMNFVLL